MDIGEFWSQLPAALIVSVAMGLLLRLIASMFNWLDRFLARH